MSEFDCVIVGSGLAGMRAAIEIAKDPKLKVAIVSKVYPTRSHSGAAQGGIAAALDNLGEDDSPKQHMFDTVKGSDWLGDQDAIKLLTHGAPAVVRELEHFGVIFSRTPEGKIAQRHFGGHTNRRACYAADWTGHAILHGLNEQLVKHGVTVFSEWQMITLINQDNVVRGITVYDFISGKLELLEARSVLLATGGYGRAFDITSNAHASTGDGLVAAYNTGVPLQDMEFVQFHPTGLYRLGILMSEACRGEGGYLINCNEERFMSNYAPEKMELSPRDVVARAIQTEINAGRGWQGEGAVAIDLRHLGRERILERLPQVRELALDFIGLDLIDKPIPIQPTAHYSMGGVPCDNHGQVHVDSDNSVPVTGLFAAGECACISVHGANRLGTNSLLEAVLFGQRAGARISEVLGSISRQPVPDGARAEGEKRLQSLMDRDGDEKMGTIRGECQRLMSRVCGVFREEGQLKEGREQLAELRQRYQQIRISDRGTRYNTDLMTAFETENILIFCETMLAGALNRTESRGAHFRTDFPKRNDEEWMKHTLLTRGEDGEPVISYKPVRKTVDEADHVPPQERKY